MSEFPDPTAGDMLVAAARDVCVRDAAQILRPPVDGLPYCGTTAPASSPSTAARSPYTTAG